MAIILALSVPIAFASATAADVPQSVGPQGFLVWETPRSVPELHFEDGSGTPLALADFQGKAVLLNIWATWCAPCRDEMPTLDSLQAELGGDRFEVVALSIDHEGIAIVQDFYRKVGVGHLRQYIDPTAMAGSTLGVTGVPTTLLLDSQGRELGRLVGATD
tara:strand:+ start:750 stop:1232 length:483 start_codon:yes stop_codon:yes gene_type:complete